MLGEAVIRMIRRRTYLPQFLPCSAVRSGNMAAIKSRGNRSTETVVLGLLKKYKFTRWRRHLPIPGRPDFAFPDLKLAIFVDGCFWHACPRCFSMPQQNIEYWTEKIRRNIQRDRKNARLLRAKGWSVMHIWEHSLRRSPEKVGKRIAMFVKKKQGELGQRDSIGVRRL